MGATFAGSPFWLALWVTLARSSWVLRHVMMCQPCKQIEGSEMTVKASAWAVRLRNISPLAKLVAIAISDNYDETAPGAVLRMAYLGEFCNVEHDDVRAALDELGEWTDLIYRYEEDGLVWVRIPIIEDKKVSSPKKPNKSHCYIYVIAAASRTKIGISRSAVVRLENLQAWTPETLRLAWTVSGPRHLIREIEAACHNELAAQRVAGEWFSVSPDEAIAVVKRVMPKYGLVP
jgi:T5orf172 domain